MIPYGKQHINQADIDAVTRVLESDFLTQGPKVTQFEAKVAQHCGAQFAVASNSATSSLHVACLALNVGPGDLVWTSPISFVASSNAALYCGADIDFVDVDQESINLCPQKLSDKLQQAKAAGRLPKVLIVVHFGGLPCDMEQIASLCADFDIKIIEDASHALGAYYQGKAIGGCHHSDICVFSFHPVKNVTSAEGGVATTNNPELAHLLRLHISHGITKDKGYMANHDDEPWFYEQQSLGYNYRLSDVHAALGASQMDRLPEFIEKRQAIAARYVTEFADTALTWQARPDDRTSAYHLFVIRLEDPSKRLCVFNGLREKNIGVNIHYIPIYKQPYYQDKVDNPELFLNAEAYYSSCISLPIFPLLTDTEHAFVISTVKELIQ